MSRILLIVIFSLSTFLNLINGQETVKSINCIILIEEQLSEALSGKFEFNDSSGSKSIIEFGYENGEMRFIEKDYKKLESLRKYTRLNMKIEDKSEGYSYTKKIDVIDLRQRYIILKIYNCRKNASRVYIETPRHSDPTPKTRKTRKLKCKRYLPITN
ncbi:hypothetical protein [Aquimarina pacifica]|uniref:hypothetical protein n=1 Tax=Aquimarina pacifica TaxID=1296415 RepID=UPI00046EDB28|nr:hypothetical protein [Aquimarina pacifica]